MEKKKKSLFRRVNNWLHLWLGLISGTVVFIVCLTGALWTFRSEFTHFLDPGQRLQAENRPFLSPSALKVSAASYLASQGTGSQGVLRQISYRAGNRSSYIAYRDSVSGEYDILFVNPYTGAILHRQVGESRVDKAMMFLRAGHRFFWMPREIGSPFVGANCIIFLLLLITGLIWWYPAKWTKSTRDKSFKVKWNAGWKRLNLDLHNVFGFYAFLLVMLLTVTGITFSFEWFADGLTWLISGGKAHADHQHEVFFDHQPKQHSPNAEDRLWRKHYAEYLAKQHDELMIIYPMEEQDNYLVNLRPQRDAIRNILTYRYGRNSLQPIDEPDNESDWSQKMHETNFDIHVGSIGGMTTKILASLASLVGASLPVTGFIIWYNRKWGKKKAAGRPRKVRVVTS